jgi:hypothetical protein
MEHEQVPHLRDHDDGRTATPSRVTVTSMGWAGTS